MREFKNTKNNLLEKDNDKFKTLEELKKENIVLKEEIKNLDLNNKEYYNRFNELEKRNKELLTEYLYNTNRLREIEGNYHSIIDSKTYSIFKIYSKVKRKIKNKKNKLVKIKTDSSKVVKIDKNSRLNEHELINILKDYSIISFDLFDTLIFRKVINPTDLFQLLEIDNAIDNFSKMRQTAEKEARKNTKKKNKEINIYDIYNELSSYLDIDVSKLINKEFELETKLCYPNEYMLSVFNKLKELNKKIIITSDMYWPKEYLTKLLNKCGYNGYYDLFVSCDIELNKGTGEIQKYISKKLKEKNIIHVGDNHYSDILGSSKANWKTYHYKNCKDVALYNNDIIYSNSLLNSVISSIKANYLYNGSNEYNIYYKYGFNYGGILTCGFLEYINELVKKYNYDKVLFMARDAKILYDAYNKYYCECDNEYFVTSRSAMLEISFEKNIKSFIDFYFKLRKEIGKYTIEESLVQTDLGFMIDKLKKYKLNLNDKLNKDNYDAFVKMIYEEKEEIIKHFQESKEYAVSYMKKMIGKSKRVLCVDLGWNGTIVTLLREFVKENISEDINIFGTFVGNNDNLKVNSLIDKEIFFPYCFSYNNKKNDINVGSIEGSTKVIFIEAMFTSNEPTLLKYDKEFLYGNKTNNDEILSSIHSGIMKFVELYKSIDIDEINCMRLNSDIAFKPLFDVLNNYRYNYEIFRNFQEYKDSLPRFYGDRELTTIGQILKDRGII